MLDIAVGKKMRKVLLKKEKERGREEGGKKIVLRTATRNTT